MPFLHMPNNGCNAIKPNQISVAMHLNQRLAFMLKAPSQGRTRLSPRDTQKQTSDYEHGSLNVAMPRFYRVKEIPNRLVVACRVAPARCGTQDATHTALAYEPHCTRVRTTLHSRANHTALAYEPEPAVCGALGNIAAAYRHATGAKQRRDDGEVVKPLTNLRAVSKRNRFCLEIVGLGLPERGSWTDA